MEKKSFTTYQSVYNDLESKIISGFYKENEQLPSVREMCEIYAVSVITIRKSIQMLKENGYIYSEERVGNFVANTNKNIYQLRVDRKCFTYPITKVDTVCVKSVPNKKVEEEFQMKFKNAKCVEVQRLYYYESLPCMYERTYILHSRHLNFQTLDENKWVENMWEVLHNYDINKKIFITIENDESSIRNMLLLGEYDSVFKITTEYFSSKNTVIGFSEQYVMSDDFILRCLDQKQVQ